MIDANKMLELADYLDRLESDLIANDADALISDKTPPSVWADRIRSGDVAAEAGEPVAWLVPSDETGFCRIWWRDKDRADAWIAKHPDCTLVPLYATPQSSMVRRSGNGILSASNNDH